MLQRVLSIQSLAHEAFIALGIKLLTMNGSHSSLGRPTVQYGTHVYHKKRMFDLSFNKLCPHNYSFWSSPGSASELVPIKPLSEVLHKLAVISMKHFVIEKLEDFRLIYFEAILLAG